jgi:hypothetical protein
VDGQVAAKQMVWWRVVIGFILKFLGVLISIYLLSVYCINVNKKKRRSLNSNFNLIYLGFFITGLERKNSDVKKDVGFDLGKWWQEEKTRCINYKL